MKIKSRTSKNLIYFTCLFVSMFFLSLSFLGFGNMSAKAKESNDTLSLSAESVVFTSDDVFSSRDSKKMDIIASAASVDVISSGLNISSGKMYVLDVNNWGSVNMYYWGSGWDNNASFSKISNTNIYYFNFTSTWTNLSGFLFNKAKDNWTYKTGDITSAPSSMPAWYANNSTSSHTTMANVNGTAQVINMISTDGGSTFSQSASSGCVSKVSGYTLNSGATSATSVSASTSSSSSTASISAAYGSNVSLSGTASNGYTFKGFSTTKQTSGTPSGVASTASYTASAYNGSVNTPYYAYYVLNQYSVTKNTPDNGTVALSSTKVNHGESVTVTVTPDAGYKVSTFTVNGTDYLSSLSNKIRGGTYTISNITANKTVNVTFEEATYYALGPAVNGNVDNWNQGLALSKVSGTLYSVTVPEENFSSGNDFLISFSDTADYAISGITVDTSKCVGVDLNVSTNNNTYNNNFTVTLQDGYSSPYRLYYDYSANKIYFTASPALYNLDYYDGTTQVRHDSYLYGTGKPSLYSYTKEGYAFVGWYENSTCTGEAVTEVSTTETGDKKLYAKYVSNIDVSSVSLSVADSCNVGDSVTITPTVSGGIVNAGTEIPLIYKYFISYDSGDTWESIQSGEDLTSYTYQTSKTGEGVLFKVTVEVGAGTVYSTDSAESSPIDITIVMREITFKKPANASSFDYTYINNSLETITVTSATQDVTVQAAGGREITYTVTPNTGYYVSEMNYVPVVTPIVNTPLNFTKKSGVVTGNITVTSNATVEATLTPNPKVTIYGYENDGTTAVNTSYAGVRLSSVNGGASGSVYTSKSFQVLYNNNTTSSTEENSGGTVKMVAELLNSNRYEIKGWYSEESGANSIENDNTYTVNGSSFKVTQMADDKSSATVSNVTGDIDIYVHFIPKYELTVNYSNLSSLQKDSSSITSGTKFYINKGNTVTFVAEPEDEYKLTDSCWVLSGDGKDTASMVLSEKSKNCVVTIGSGDIVITITPIPATYTGSNGYWGQKVYYLNATSWDKNVNEWYAAYFWDSTNEASFTWVRMMPISSGSKIYKCVVPENVDRVIFGRMKAGSFIFDFLNKYDQTYDQDISTIGDKNIFVASSFGGVYSNMQGSWGTYSE